MEIRASSVCVLALWALRTIAVADPGDASIDAPRASTDLDGKIGFMLDHPLAETEYSRVERCVLLNNYESIEILDSRHLLFRGSRGTVWLNQLRFDCVGMRKDDVLIFDVHDRSLCDTDSFRSTQRFNASTSFGMRCVLGHFESITQAQADVLRDALVRAKSTQAGGAEDE